MNLKRLRKTMGCLVLAGAVTMASPQVAFAAEVRAGVMEKTQEVNSESGTEHLTESDTEELTEPHTESTSESETRLQTEPQKQVQTEAQSNSETSVTEPGTTLSTETDSGKESGTEDESDEAREKRDRDRKNEIKTIDPSEDVEEPEDHSDANADLTTNVIAGNAIYLGELSTVYHLTFEEGFSEVMEEIEENFCQWLDKPEEFRAGNWQDVLSVYILRMREQTGKQEVVLNAGAKEELEKIFFFMNVRSGSIITKKLSKEVDLEAEICSLDVNDYAELKNLGDEEKAVLTKYTNEECKKLCTIATAAKGFVRSEVSGDVSDARAAIAVAACSLVGKVGYFWGGKSYAIGWDPRWGDDATVTAGGSRSTGTTRGYGLDCSGFVCWAYYNGLGGTDGGIGNHTTTQWNATEMIDSSEAKPGDLVFYAPPTAGDQNHVGMVIGRNDDGSLIVVHCSSSQNGVVVGEAWSSGFKYVRRAAFLG
ncbi:NlpC/P60 family protein [Lachnospiraceae bacterium 46-15]